MLPHCERARSISGSPEGPYRAIESVDALAALGFEGVDTLDKLFLHAVKRFSHAPCLGTREVLSEEEETQPNGKIFKKVNLSSFTLSLFLCFCQVFRDENAIMS